MRKRTRRGTGAERNTCSTTLASTAVYSSSTSAKIATRIIFSDNLAHSDVTNGSGWKWLDPSRRRQKEGTMKNTERARLDGYIGTRPDLFTRYYQVAPESISGATTGSICWNRTMVNGFGVSVCCVTNLRERKTMSYTFSHLISTLSSSKLINLLF